MGDSGSAIFNQKEELIAVLYSGNITATTLPFIGSMISSHVNCVDTESVKLFIQDILNL